MKLRTVRLPVAQAKWWTATLGAPAHTHTHREFFSLSGWRPEHRLLTEQRKIFINLSKLYHLTCHAYNLARSQLRLWRSRSWGADHIPVSSMQLKYILEPHIFHILISAIPFWALIRTRTCIIKIWIKVIINKVLNADQSILIKIAKTVCLNQTEEATSSKWTINCRLNI